MEPTSFNIGTPSEETTSSDGWVLTSLAPAPPRVEPTFTSEEYLGMRTPASVGLGAGYTEGIPEGSTPTFEFSGRVRRQKTVLSLEQAVPPPPRQGMREKELIAPSTEERARARQTPILESTPATLRPQGGAVSFPGAGLPSPPTPVTPGWSTSTSCS
mgnify:CR=1 FL=1